MNKLLLLVEENSQSIKHFKEEFKELQKKSEQNIKNNVKKNFTNIEELQDDLKNEIKTKFSNLEDSIKENFYINIFFVVVIVSGLGYMFIK